jgi:hypothetical protein
MLNEKKMRKKVEREMMNEIKVKIELKGSV